MARPKKQHDYKMIEQASAGNAEAKIALWLYLYAELPPLINRVASARGVARQDIDDAVHEVVWRIMANIEELRAPKSFGVYAFRIMQHVARMFRPQRNFEPFDEQMVPGACEDRDLNLDVARALAELPPCLADAVIRVYFEGRSYEEASVVLGCSTRSIKRRLQKARARIRVLLESPVRLRPHSKASTRIENQFPIGRVRPQMFPT